MTYPASVATRPVQIGGAVSVEDGRSLSIRVDTTASRSLVHQLTGTRMEKVPLESKSFFIGEAVWWEIAATDQSNTYLDGETRQVIMLGEDEHTHLYTTTLTILKGTEQISQYVIGPYPVPAGGGILDLDRQLIPDGTAEGTLVAIPAGWADIIAEAYAIANLRGLPNGIAELDSTGVVPDDQLPSRLSNAALSTMVENEVEAVAPAIIAADSTIAAAGAAAAEAAVDAAVEGMDVVQLVKCVHLEAGVWVWDGPDAPTATHYLIPDENGELVARPTPFPTPSAIAPELNW